jgi:hypothetical protein
MYCISNTSRVKKLRTTQYKGLLLIEDRIGRMKEWLLTVRSISLRLLSVRLVSDRLLSVRSVSLLL